MAHGYPDYGLAAALSTLYSTVDFGELAVRLGSPVRYERLGNVAFYDDFSAGIGTWYQTTTNGDETLEVRFGNGVWSGYALRMRPGLLADGLCYVLRRFPLRVLSKTGLEVSWYGGASLGQAIVTVGLQVFLDTESVAVSFRWDHGTGRLLWGDASGVYWDLADGSQVTHAYQAEHTMKFVLDPFNKVVSRLLIDSLSYGVGSVVPRTWAVELAGRVYVSLTCEMVGAGAFEYDWGGVCVTVNEP